MRPAHAFVYDVQPMTRTEFLDLWKQDKSIVEEVRFVRSKTYPDVYEFDDVRVLADFAGELWVSGTYECKIGAVRYSFHVKGVGAIARYCMGGTEHDGSRYHYHDLRTSECAKNNLPIVIPRNEMRDWTAKQVWYQALKEGNIHHSETFYEPEGYCV